MIADMLAQCLRQIPGAKQPCGIGPRSPFDHVCERAPAVVAKSQRNVLRFARGGAGCSLVETHHDHSLLQAAKNHTAGARRARRASRSARTRAGSLTDPLPPHARTAAKDITTFVVLREPIERSLSAWHMEHNVRGDTWTPRACTSHRTLFHVAHASHSSTWPRGARVRL